MVHTPAVVDAQIAGLYSNQPMLSWGVHAAEYIGTPVLLDVA